MVQMVKNQLDMIEADLKVLQSEFKKKNPQIREVSSAFVLYNPYI